jgi:hypothetical protein
MNKQYGITGLILIVVLTTIMISGCIGGDDNTTNDKFTNAVTFQGITFYLPDGFESMEKKTESYYIYESFSDGTNVIGLGYYPSLSKSEILSNMKSTPSYTNIDESASFGGYSGHSADFTAGGEVIKYFVFEKDGKTLVVGMDKGLNFKEYVPKIIG